MLGIELSAVILHIELDATKLNDISSSQFVVHVILSRFGVSHDHKHFIVHVLIWNCISILVSGSLRNQSVVFNLEHAIVLPDNNHGFGNLVHLLRLSPYGNKLNIVIDPENFSASLSLDIFLGDIFGFVVEKSVGISGPCHTAHIHFILRSLQNHLTIFGWSLCHDLLHVHFLRLEPLVRIPSVLSLDWSCIDQTIPNGIVEMLSKALSFWGFRFIDGRRLLSFHLLRLIAKRFAKLLNKFELQFEF